MIENLGKTSGFRCQHRGNARKARFEKTLFFSFVFCNRFWGGFGKGFERGLEPLGASWASSGRLFLRLVFVGRYGTGSWLHFGRYGAGFGSILGGMELDFVSILEGTELDFGSILKGCLGVVWGGL